MEQLTGKELLLLAHFLNVEKLHDVFMHKKFRMCADSPLAGKPLYTKETENVFGPDVKVLGFGSFGQVKGSNQNSQEFANKYTEKKYMVIKEIAIMHYLDHPNILCISGVSEDDNNIILSEPLAATNLDDPIIFEMLKKDAILRKDAYYQIFCGLAYLHSIFVVHLDIKPGNILVFKEKEKYIYKITDFGSAITCSFIQNVRYANMGTIEWFAPETLNDPYSIVSDKNDIWAMGVIMYDIIYQKDDKSTIFDVYNSVSAKHTKHAKHAKHAKHIELIKRLKNIIDKGDRYRTDLYSKFSAGEQELAEKCLTIEPLARPTALECLRDSFFDNIRQKDYLSLITNTKNEPIDDVNNYKHRSELSRLIVALVQEGSKRAEFNEQLIIYVLGMVDKYVGKGFLQINQTIIGSSVYYMLYIKVSRLQKILKFSTFSVKKFIDESIKGENPALSKPPYEKFINDFKFITSFETILTNEKYKKEISDVFIKAGIKEITSNQEYNSGIGLLLKYLGPLMQPLEQTINILLCFIDIGALFVINDPFIYMKDLDELAISILENMDFQLFIPTAVQYYSHTTFKSPTKDVITKIFLQIIKQSSQKKIADNII